jgi:DNA-binding LacI/PurR family transcriptional regulator
MTSPTIKDIARIAGVSHSTVSRALHDHPALAPETIARIKRIALEQGYMPSAMARGLKTSRSRALGVILSFIDDPFFSQVLQGIEDVLQPAGYSLFVAASHRDAEREQLIVRAMAERRVEGVIVCSTPFQEEHARQLQEYNVPVAVVNNQAAEEYRYSIYHDDRDGIRQVTHYLLDLGHRQIAYLGNILAGRTTQERLLGYQEEMRQAGLPTQDAQAPNGRPEGGFAGARVLIDQAKPPSAIVCFNDMIALGVLRALDEAGRRVPQDCSVTGFDNISISAFTAPPLTTFNQPKYELGFEAAQMMLRLLDCPPGDLSCSHPEKVLLSGNLLVRGSTAAPAGPLPAPR